MAKENDLEFLESYHAHASSQRGTDNFFVRSVKIAVELLKKGSTIEEALNAADQFVEQVLQQKLEKNTGTQP